MMEQKKKNIDGKHYRHAITTVYELVRLLRWSDLLLFVLSHWIRKNGLVVDELYASFHAVVRWRWVIRLPLCSMLLGTLPSEIFLLLCLIVDVQVQLPYFLLLNLTEPNYSSHSS